MRSRSNSGVKLDNYAKLVQKSILKFQDPVTGLFSASKEQPHAWVRDNVYSIQAIWGLALAYKKQADLDEDKAKAYELEQNVVKCMRSLLLCMIRQAHKVELFKASQLPRDSLHAKYCRRTLGCVVGDGEWGHLQLDATGLYLLMLAQMTASGLKVIYDLDEVAFVQNLVFYISMAYRTPDYGIWERGDKTNHGVPELNASSVGMCKAALEAIDELNLFGPAGGPQSVIHVTPDEKALCKVILESMLPRESTSKEIDAGLLSVISYPAFAVSDPALVELTKKVIVDKLQGRYGCSRFLRDGYKTACEDPSRLHYEAAELKVFENIECEWPVFWTFFILDGLIHKNREQADEYMEALDELLIHEDGIRCVPELFTVPKDKVEAEKANPHSQDRTPTGKLPHLWGQSLYILGKLIWEGYLDPGEIDPLNRRFATHPKPDIVVQVVLMAEEKLFQTMLKEKMDLDVETEAELAPIQVRPARTLSEAYSSLGRNKKLKLSGRPDYQLGILGTCKVYRIRGDTYLFTPKIMDQRSFYVCLDTEMLIDMMVTELQYLVSTWKSLGRPLLLVPVHRGMLTEDGAEFKPSLITTLKKLQSGYLSGVRIVLGSLSKFLSTSCVTRLTFLDCEDVNSEELRRKLAKPESELKTKRLRQLSECVENSTEKSSISSPATSETNRQQLSDTLTSLPNFKHKTNLTKKFDFGRKLTRQKSIDENKLREAVQERKLKIDNVNLLKMSTLEAESSALLEILRKTDRIYEQSELLMKICEEKGLDWSVKLDGKNEVKVTELIEEIYNSAADKLDWLVIRQMSSLTEKKVVGLSQSVTDLLVRQKQVTVGFPRTSQEITITRPVSDDELHQMISDAFSDDKEISVLAQEIIMYLGMFIRSSPRLFNDLLRLRIGLIIQVMASELALHFNCVGEVATEYLMKMSPFETKQVLYNILSGKEFGMMRSVSRSTKYGGQYSIIGGSRRDRSHFDSIKLQLKSQKPSGLLTPSGGKGSTRNISASSFDTSELLAPPPSPKPAASSGGGNSVDQSQFSGHKRGLWLRRRRIDGAMNRVPQNFYTRIWHLLEKCNGLIIGGHTIPGYLTKEMTAEELKFALHVENVFNHIPQPEYRQLLVETLIVLAMISDSPKVHYLPQNIDVSNLLDFGNSLFIEKELSDGGTDLLLQRDSNTKICLEFYDCAPSGPHGTMTFISSAVARSLAHLLPATVNDCLVS